MYNFVHMRIQDKTVCDLAPYGMFFLAFLLPAGTALWAPTLARAQSNANADDPRVNQLYREAKEAQTSGDQAGAIAKYKSILQIAPGLAAAYNNLCLLYFQQREYRQAIAVLERGLKIHPEMPSASTLLRISLYEIGEYKQARPRLEAALRSNPSDNNAELFLANDLIKLGELDQVIREKELRIVVRSEEHTSELQ